MQALVSIGHFGPSFGLSFINVSFMLHTLLLPLLTPPPPPGKLAFESLKQLFHRKDIGEKRAMEYQLYISAWEVGSDSRETVSDLLPLILDEENDDRGASRNDRSFKALHIPTLKHASTILSLLPSKITVHPHPANLFVRVLLRSEVFNTTSAVHFIDMVPSSSAPPGREKPFARKSAKKNPSSRGRQHHAFAKVLNSLEEAATASRNNSRSQERSSQSILLASARESKLTQMLAPLLGGNGRLWLVGHLRKEAEFAQEACTTLKLLGSGTKVMCGCVKVSFAQSEPSFPEKKMGPEWSRRKKLN